MAHKVFPNALFPNAVSLHHPKNVIESRLKVWLVLPIILKIRNFNVGKNLKLWENA